MIDLDPLADMKLVRAEPETPALRRWIDAQPSEAWVTSELGRVEVLRAARRAGDEAVARARGLTDSLDLVPLDRTVQDAASEIGSALLRTLDVLHLASALVIVSEVSSFVSYDHRLAEAAKEVDLRVDAPG